MSDSPSQPTASPPQAAPDASAEADSWGYDLLLQGNEEILKASDTGTLVAFAAIAYQEVRGASELHHTVGCGFLLLSVFLCAVVHLAIGNAYIRRAHALIKGNKEMQKLLLSRKVNITFAWIAAAVQFSLVLGGVTLMLMDQPPKFMVPWLDAWFG